MKKLVFSFFCVMQVLTGWAQANGSQAAAITGKVVDSKAQKSVQSVIVEVENTAFSAITNEEGVFTVEGLPAGKHLIRVTSAGFTQQLLPVEVAPGQKLDLGVVVLAPDQTEEQQLSLITITENDLGDDNSGSESTAGLLQASRDAFQQSAAFNWGQARFRIRGLDNEYGTTMINGIVMNKIYDGRPQWGNWGGLNDATRNQEFTTGLSPSDYTFGGILGTQEINTRASLYRPGGRVSFAGTNTNYNWRTMATYASGMDENGIAYVISAGKRWAKEGYFEGTDYDANSVFASVEKKIGENHSLNVTAIYAQNSRGKNSPNTNEVTSLAGEKYNSYWGWQDGKKRNSRDKDVEEPIIMLSHYWKISDKTKLNTNVAYQFGKIGNSRLDYQDVNNPDPTYYRNLPSFYTSYYNIDQTSGTIPDSAYQPGGLGGVWTPNYELAGAAAANFVANKQIDWNMMYQANSTAIMDANGQEIGRAPARSKYVLYEDRTDDKLVSANSILNAQLSDNIVFNGGVAFRNLRSHNFKNMLDLLGGLYYADINAYGANANQNQNDLNHPNRQIGEDDTFGYNYNLMANTIDAFTQFRFTYKKFDFFLAQSYQRADYQREGLYRNGYYPANSFGKSNTTSFDGFGFKGGLTYKITGRQFFTVNGAYMSKAPSMRNTYPNARLNNNTVNGIANENISSADVSYIIRDPKFKARLTAFYSKSTHATETSFFFADGVSLDSGSDDSNSDATSFFVAETVTNLSKQNMGVELGAEYQITSTIKAIVSGNYGQYTYANNPNVSLNADALASATNTNPIQDFGESKLKNLKQPGTPQHAASLGLEYRDPKFWWVGANANYLGANYIDVAPLLRTDNFFKNPTDLTGGLYPEATEERARQLLKQEKFDDFYLVNLTGGKSWKIGSQIVGFFASVNNVFDVTYKTGGYEQARNASYRDLNQDVSSGTPVFAPKYFYGYGRTYFLNLYINF